jgi:hypothetical protein
MTITQQLIEHLNQMDDHQQQHLLNFARTLTKTTDIRGESGMSIVHATRMFDEQSLSEMAKAIAEDCEGVDFDAWQ